MMENSVKRKINVFGKVAKIITMIVIVFLLVAEGFLLTGGVVVACVPKDAVTVDATAQFDAKIDNKFFGIDEGKVNINAGNSKITVGEVDSENIKLITENGKTNANATFRDLHFDLRDALWLILSGMGSIASMVVALFFFRALMMEFATCDSPFCDGVVQKMKAFAIALIPCLAVSQMMRAAIGAVMTGDFSFNVDMVSVAFVFIIFVLAMVFKYGAELQKEHDETV